jgi:hypothetical protein
MQIRLKESYGNKFVTTAKGNVIYQGKWTLFDENDRELEHLLKNNIFEVLMDDGTIESKENKVVGVTTKILE